jgi:uncharacterized LabA/DUF88 family protein
MPDRVIAFVDGFNVYHALDGDPRYIKYKWLNLWSLAGTYVTKKQKLKAVYYFSAFASWDNRKERRHKTYIRALESAGVRTVLGQFKRVTRKCRADCRKQYRTFEEKETDVNIALEIYRQAVRDNYDTAFIVSADSDLIPPIRMIRKEFPDKTFTAIIPIGGKAEAMKAATDRYFRIKVQHLAACQFPKTVKLRKKATLKRPDSWR